VVGRLVCSTHIPNITQHQVFGTTSKKAIHNRNLPPGGQAPPVPYDGEDGSRRIGNFSHRLFSMALLTTEQRSSIASSAANYVQVSKIDENKPLRFAIVDEKQILACYYVWGENNKSERRAFRFITRPTDAEIEAEMTALGYSRRPGFDKLTLDQPKFCVNIPIYSFNDEGIKIISITQKGIIQELDRISQVEDYEDLTAQDFQLSRKGSGLETTYHLIVLPRKAAQNKVIEEAWTAVSADFDMKRLLDNGDPFVKA
jgi:hypothetical protein